MQAFIEGHRKAWEESVEKRRKFSDKMAQEAREFAATVRILTFLFFEGVRNFTNEKDADSSPRLFGRLHIIYTTINLFPWKLINFPPSSSNSLFSAPLFPFFLSPKQIIKRRKEQLSVLRAERQKEVAAIKAKRHEERIVKRKKEYLRRMVRDGTGNLLL